MGRDLAICRLHLIKICGIYFEKIKIFILVREKVSALFGLLSI